MRVVGLRIAQDEHASPFGCDGRMCGGEYEVKVFRYRSSENLNRSTYAFPSRYYLILLENTNKCFRIIQSRDGSTDGSTLCLIRQAFETMSLCVLNRTLIG